MFKFLNAFSFIKIRYHLPFLLLLISCTSTNKVADANKNQTSANTKIRFGVMVAKTDNQTMSLEKQVMVAKSLGVNYMRSRINVETWKGSDKAYEYFMKEGLQVILNVNWGVPRNAAGEQTPIPFATGMKEYADRLNDILNKYKPEVVVVENEEDNPIYYTGTAEEYINVLRTAINVAHSKGLKISNGGITERAASLMLYDDYMQHGQEAKAKEFASRAFPERFRKTLTSQGKKFIERTEFRRKILEAYKTLDLDYVNFHWYEPSSLRFGVHSDDKDADKYDLSVLKEVTEFLKAKTGKPLMNNEFGIFNASAELTTNLLQAVYDANVYYAIFYSADGGKDKAVALQNADGSLRTSGVAFKQFIQKH